MCLGVQRFAQYGVLKPGEDGAPRVKLYRDKATQMPKGDGLVTFLYQPSVSAPEPKQCLQGWVWMLMTLNVSSQGANRPLCLRSSLHAIWLGMTAFGQAWQSG